MKNEQGQTVTPKEWFLVPFNVIENVVKKINEGTITKYKYDSNNKKLIKK